LACCRPNEFRTRSAVGYSACRTPAYPAGIGLAGVVAEYGSTFAAGLAVLAIWLAVATALVLSRALVDLEPTGDTVGRVSSP
jgi:hypothetical protein